MSNDDFARDYLSFLRSLNPLIDRKVIGAFCPNFDRLRAGTVKALKILGSKRYQLYFYVLKWQYGGRGTISEDEIMRLRAVGKVEVYTGKSDSSTRAKLFRRFITRNVRR